MPSLAYTYSLANRQGQGVLRCQLLRQHALHPNLPPRAARGAGPRRADRIHLSTSLTTNQTVCTDLPATYLTRLEHSQAAALFISRLQAHTSKLQLYPPRCAHRANLEPRWPVYRTRQRSVPPSGKRRHSPHVTDISVSLTAAVRAAHMAFSAPRCTPEQSLLWRPWARRFDWSSLPSGSRFRPSTPLSCARRSLTTPRKTTTSPPRTLTRSQAVRVRSV